MKTLLAVLVVLAMATSAMALECPMESLNIYHQDETGIALSYSCDNGLETHFVQVPQGTTRKAIAEIVLTGENAIVLLNKTCFEIAPLKMTICHDN